MAVTKHTKAFYNTEIPSDWEVKELGEIGELKNGINKEKEDFGFGFPMVNLIDVFGINKVYKNNFQLGLVNATERDIKEYSLQKGDVLFIRSSVKPEGVGLTTVICDDLENTTYSGFIIRFRDNGCLDLEYKAHCFFEEGFRRRLLNKSTISANTNINQGALNSLKIPLPPLPEQKAIAQVLSTADAAIQTTEKLIAQKELRKKWLMQQLLTGKKRLLYDELGMMNYEWKPIRIGDVFKFIKSYSISREGLQNDNEGSVFCIHYGDIHARYDSSFLDFERQKNIPQLIDNNISIEESNYLQDGDIVMADASEDYEGVGAAVEVKNLSNKKAIGGLHTLVLRADKKNISPDFAAYFFSSEKVRNMLRKYATGTSVYSVTKTQIHNLSFIIPNSLKEQTAIARVLQAVDKEISLLKAKAEKLREQKKGLMQVLLTGKVRLKINN